MSAIRDVVSRHLPWLVFLGFLGIYSATVSTHSVNTDAAANSTTAWQIAHTGRPWMDGLDLREPGVVIHYAEGADGHMVTTRTPGQIWLAVPFYLGSTTEQSEITWTRGGLAAAFATALAMLLVFLSLRRRLGDRVALAAVAVLGLTTPIWSVSADALWTHPVTVLGLAGATWAADRERWWLAGLFFGLGMFARVHLAIVAAVVGLIMAWRRRDPMIALRVGLTSGLCMALLVIWNHYVFGAWSLRSGYGITADQLSGADGNIALDYVVNVAGFLVSPNRGLLLWSPLVLVLIPFLRAGWATSPDWVRSFAVGGLTYTAIQLRINGFGGGDSFWGYRLGLELLVCATPLLVFAATRAKRWGALILVVSALQFAVTALGAMSTPLTLVVPDELEWTRSALLFAVTRSPALLIVLGMLFALWVLSGRLFAHWLVPTPSDSAPHARALGER